MEAADRDRDISLPELARQIERARKLVGLHADEADEAAAGRADAPDRALDVDDGVALVIGLDLDIGVGAERLVASAHSASRPCTLARLLDGMVERHHWMT